uniref:DET1- and DDB1-associated protein 1 n=1 Tax=Phallusia mammillata TaxID=59560 RepID=A0A6F9DJ24_9ASCI|nr:uncharacterized protein LOC104265547 [Phallusia mammillata]
MGTPNLLDSLPSYNAKNFSKFQPESGDKRSSKKLSVYISTEASEPQQVIKKDRSNVLLRYLYQQLDKKNKSGDAAKRKVQEGASSSHQSETEPRPKMAKATNSELLMTSLTDDVDDPSTDFLRDT